MNILVINGPNLNLLGIREPEIYGRGTYDELVAFIGKVAEECDVEDEERQKNHEGVIVDWITGPRQVLTRSSSMRGIYSTSIAIHDA